MKTMYAVPEILVKRHIPEDYVKVGCEKMRPNIAYKFEVDGVKMSDLAKAEGLKVFDVDLPIDWVREFKRLTDFNPVGHFVYSYDENRYGMPKPVTLEGIIAYRIYSHLTRLVANGDVKLKD